MTVLQRLAVAFIVLVFAAYVYVAHSNLPYAEAARSWLATAYPGYFGHLRKLPDVPLAWRLKDRGFALGQPVAIRIFKHESILELWMKRGARYEIALSYPICRWSGGLGPKIRDGDDQSPEGYYFVSRRNLNPNSRFHLAINTGFPNAYDQSLGRTGSALMIHGSCVSAGCYAITDAGVDDIYKAVAAAFERGQSRIALHIYPFRLTAENLARAEGKWLDFWRNLAEGDRLFAATGEPPAVWACGGRYEFGSRKNGCRAVTSW